MGKENIKSFFSTEQVTKIEGSVSHEERERLLSRMQEILDQEHPLSESDKVELDYLEIEMREFDKLAQEKVEQKETVLDDPVIGGRRQIDANDLPDSHRAPRVSKPEPQKGEYV